MNEIPKEIRKMFPDQPIHKLDIVDGELQILASAEPLEPDPHFEAMPIEQVNQYLRDHGYDPEQVGLRGKILADALIENIHLRARAEAAEHDCGQMQDMMLRINNWLGENPDFDLHYEPPWYKELFTFLFPE